MVPMGCSEVITPVVPVEGADEVLSLAKVIAVEAAVTPRP